MRRIGLILVLLSLLVSTSFGTAAEKGSDLSPITLHSELDMMFRIKIGPEFHLTPRWSLRGTLGLSPLGITMVAYNLYAVYYVRAPERKFQWDLEAGLLRGYFDFIEGRWVDWDSTIDEPYAGWAPGVACCWSYQSKKLRIGLRTGITYSFEIQGGEWKEPRWFPDFAVELSSRRR